MMPVKASFSLLAGLLSLIVLQAPAGAQSQQIIINRTADSTLSKQALQKIRSMDNNLFDAAAFTGNDDIEIRYRLFKPRAKNSATQYPLVVVFHGSGAIGTDNTAQLGLLPKLFASADNQDSYPAYVLAPQFPARSSDYVPDSSRNVLVSVPGPCLQPVLLLIDSLKRHLNIDSKRIYAVGYSMGASTVINALSARPDLFAAGISIAGIPQFSKSEQLRAIPLWLIHGIDDAENKIGSDERFYQELHSRNNILFWKLKETTHDNIFSTQLLGETLPQWLFKQQKNRHRY